VREPADPSCDKVCGLRRLPSAAAAGISIAPVVPLLVRQEHLMCLGGIAWIVVISFHKVGGKVHLQLLKTGWFLWMVLVDGSCGWFLWMVLVDGSCGWFLWMVLVDGSCGCWTRNHQKKSTTWRQNEQLLQKSWPGIHKD
jgi:hypothetical protein